MSQLTDDCFAFGDELVRLDAALSEFSTRLVPIAETERVPVPEALDRVAADDLVSTRLVPPTDNSAVDGFAVAHGDLAAEGPTRLPVADRIAAGHPSSRPFRRGEAVRIFTGAAIPEGDPSPDTILMQEDCREIEEAGDRYVEIPPGIRRGANFRHAGEDVRPGDTVIRRGRRLSPVDLGLAAAIGAEVIPVFRRLKVAVASTGDEIGGASLDSNRPMLIALLERLGFEPVDLGILPDREHAIHSALAEVAAKVDAIVTSGGMSTGEEDHVRAAVVAMGGRIHAWRLAIKPGRPVGLGQIGQTLFLGLPGNPVAVFVTFQMIARPILFARTGAEAPPPMRYPVRANFAWRKKAGRREFLRVALAPAADGLPLATRIGAEGAGVLTSVARADGLLELAEDLTLLAPGDIAPYLPFDGFR